MANRGRPDLRSGTVTFLFTDVEGSTRLLHELGAEGYAEALAEHRRVIREACAAEGGVEVDTQGDAFFVAFPTAPGALAAADVMTAALGSGAIQVRVGLHTGTPLLTDEGYVGDDVHFGARVAGSGHGGQVILSAATAELVELYLTDLGEHRLKDIPEAVPIYQLGDASFPPLKTISNTNLPRPASSFVGRERETQEVVSLLRDGARLVTLSGPGGSGKTRLAIEAAAELVPEFKAGVFWVGLAALRDPTLVAEMIAGTLGAKDGLQDHVGERELLLLLDNLEQVIDCAPELATLLEICPNLRLLVTSRELLRVRGEVEYAVPPLAEEEAVSLFCERSQLESDETIAELCRRLDDLPLAVELAAARTSVLTPAQILERLSQRLDLLKGGRDADPRQQTLRATIEWSYDLLTPEERQLFARLAVFAGGCTLDAAEEVVDADLDTLQSLVEKSLLRFTDGRYWMLETIREYAAERLGRPGDSEAVRRRHADHLLAFAEAVGGLHVHEGAQPVAIERLAQELDNIRAAIEWSLERQRFPAVLRFGAALWMFWQLRGHAVEGRRWLDAAVVAGDRGSDEWVWGALALGELDRACGDVTRARALKEEILPVLRKRGEIRAMAGTLADLADMAMEEGEHELARELLEESLELRSDPSAAPGLGRTLASLGELALLEGDFARAEELYEEAFRAAAERDPQGAHTAWSLRGLAEVRQRRADVTGAEQALRDSLRIFHGLGDKAGVANCLEGLAVTAAAQGLSERADRLVSAAEALRREEEATMTLDEAVAYALDSLD